MTAWDFSRFASPRPWDFSCFAQDAKPWDESKVKRDHGRFAEKTSVSIDTPHELLGLPMREMRERVTAMAAAKFAGTKIRMKDGSDVEITRSGIEHGLHGRVSKPMVSAALQLDELLKAAEHDRSEPDKADRNTIKAVHFYKSTAVIDGRELAVELIVREHVDGRRYYDHYEVPSEK